MVVNAVGSAVLPGNTRTATGRPAGSVNNPYSIWGSPFLPSREYPRAASGQVREFLDCLVRYLPIFAVGAAQQVCLVVPLHPILSDVVATVGRYVDCVTSFRHNRTLPLRMPHHK